MSHIAEKDRGIFLSRSYMGFRPSEARRLNVSAVHVGKLADLSDAEIWLPPHSSKMRTGRKLGIHAELAEWLVLHGRLDRFGNAPLFVNRRARNDEQRWNQYAERYTLHAACDAANVARIKPNEFGRHFLATHAISDLKMDPYKVKQMLGHRSIKTTERYGKVRSLPPVQQIKPTV